MRIALLASIALLSGVQGEELSSDQFAARMAVPESWKVDADGSSTSPALEQRTGAPSRKIQFHVVTRQADTLPAAMNEETLEAAMNGEMEKIPAFWRQGSSNTREIFADARKVKTRSGIEGLLARFVEGTKSRNLYTINKFYFRDSSGSVVVACMHVWGDELTSDRLEKVLFENLSPGRK